MVKRLLAGAAAVLALLAAMLGARDQEQPEPQRTQTNDRTTNEPPRTPRTPRNALAQPTAADLARQIENEDDHVTALELAQWIRERKPGLGVIDVRSEAEFDAYHIPSARRIPLGTLATLAPRDGETLVLYSEGGAHAAQGWVLLRSAGHRQVYFLRGGLLDWMEDVMNPSLPTDTSRARIAALSRYFGGVPRAGAVPLPDAPATGAAAAVARTRRRGC